MNSDDRHLIDALRAAGWRVEQRAGGPGHKLAFSPDGKTIVPIGRSGDWRAWRNTLARLRRAGFDYRAVTA